MEAMNTNILGKLINYGWVLFRLEWHNGLILLHHQCVLWKTVIYQEGFYYPPRCFSPKFLAAAEFCHQCTVRNKAQRHSIHILKNKFNIFYMLNGTWGFEMPHSKDVLSRFCILPRKGGITHNITYINNIRWHLGVMYLIYRFSA